MTTAVACARQRAPIVAVILRILLGAVFCFAAFMKLRDPQIFVQAVMAFKVLPDHLAVLATFAVPSMEMLAGACLILGIWQRGAALLIAGLLSGFIFLMARAVLGGVNDLHCACFGKFEWPCTGPVGQCQIIRNSVMLAVALLLVFVGPRTRCAVVVAEPVVTT